MQHIHIGMSTQPASASWGELVADDGHAHTPRGTVLVAWRGGSSMRVARGRIEGTALFAMHASLVRCHQKSCVFFF